MSYPVLMVPAGDIIPIMFDSYAGATGASITLSGLAVTDIEIYKDGSTTQRSSDNGYTLLDTDGIDFDSITGIHGFSVDTSDNSDAGFYTVGAWFTVVISAVTVDSQTVNFVAAMFRIMKAEGIAGVPKADVDSIAGSAVSTTTAQLGVNVVQLSTDATAADNAEAFFDGTGYAGTNNVIPLVTTTTTATTATNLTNLPAITANWLTATGIQADAITAAKIADGAIDNATFAADAISASKINADVTTEFNAPILAVLGALADAAADGVPTATDTLVAYIKQIINDLEGTAGIVTWPASAAPGNAVSIAEALRYLYDQVGVAGAGLTAADDAVITAVAGVQADTDDIQARLPAALTANGNIKADTLRVGGTVQTGGDLAAMITTVDDFVDTEVAAIKAVTDLLPNGGALTNLDAAISTRATPAQVNTEVLDVLTVDTFAQPAQEAPAATTSLGLMLRYLYKAFRNKGTQTSTTYSLYADDALTVDQKATVSDDATTFTRGEIGTGP